MQFDSLAAFIGMDGHGLFVWLAYGISLLVLAANWAWCGLERKSIIASHYRKASARQAREGEGQ